MNMKWSDCAWNEASHIYRSILELPFVRELSDGTLSEDRFLFYIRQDAIYIENYSRILAHIASRLPQQKQTEDFMKFASDGIMVEKLLHEAYLAGKKSDIGPTPTTLLYTSFESSKTFEPGEIEAAAILPCFWVYQKVGEEIIKGSSQDNPYSHWIETYADKTFAESTARAIEICDELAGNTTPEIREKMTRTFVMSTRMEWMFWDSAYNFEKWKI